MDLEWLAKLRESWYPVMRTSQLKRKPVRVVLAHGGPLRGPALASQLPSADVVVGLGELGSAIARRLAQAAVRVVGVDPAPGAADQHRVLCSAVAVAKAAGLDERAFYDVLVSSSGTSRAAERIGTVNPDLLAKDVKLLVSSVAESEDLLKIVRLTDPDQAFGAAVRQIRRTLAF